MNAYAITYRNKKKGEPCHFDHWFTSMKAACEFFNALIDNGFGLNRLGLNQIGKSYRVTVKCYPTNGKAINRG